MQSQSLNVRKHDERRFFMFKRNVLAVSLSLAALCSAQAAMADIVGGGGTLAAPLYQTAGVLTTGFDPYVAVGSGPGKLAFLNNDATQFKLPAGTSVHWAGSDSALTQAEVDAYVTAHGAAWGPIVQVPSAGTTVAIPFNKTGAAGTTVNLSVNDLCGVFSGRVNDWSQITNSGRTGAIQVVYRLGSSGTTELLTRFLNNKCLSEAGTFAVSSTFSTSYSLGLPANAINATQVTDPVTGLPRPDTSAGVMAAVNDAQGRITYMSPDFAAPTPAGLDDGTIVAKVGGVSPAPANASAAFNAVAVPTADLSKPLTWVPVFGTGGTAFPATGYPIIGFTNLEFSQCYADPTQTTNVRTFFSRHYGTLPSNDGAISANRFVPMPAAWKTAIRNNFITASSGLSIGNTSVCNGIGRPL
jgi:phosphate transport system substrate-binding protein